MPYRTQADKAIALLRRRGIARLNELISEGINQTTTARLVRKGRVVRLARGVYQLPNAELVAEHGFAQACKLVPNGVICLISALQFHGLTVQLPRATWMAIGSSAWMPRVTRPALRIVRFGDAALKEGVEKHKIEGVAVRITTPAYTIADCFRFRSKVGIDVALEGLREALRQKAATGDAIMQAAQRRRIWTKLQPYLETLVGHGG